MCASVWQPDKPTDRQTDRDRVLAMSEISEIFQNVYSAKLHSNLPLSAPFPSSIVWLNLTSLKAGKQISIVDVINAKFTLFVAGLRFGDYVMP